MADWNTGSIASGVLNLVDSIPDSVSGALVDLAFNEVVFVEQHLNVSIGSTGITEKYQGPLLDLTASNVLSFMEVQGADVSQIRIGDFSETKGGGSNVMAASVKLRENGLRKLRELGHNVRFYHAR